MEIPPMKTGFNIVENSSDGDHIGLVMLLLMVFSQNVMDNAYEYCTYAGRGIVTPTDIIYSLKYEAFNFCKRKSMEEYLDEANFENDEMTSENGTDDESSCSESEDGETEFSQADSKTNKFCKDMNEINEFWENWTPTDPIESILKKSVDASIAEQLLIDSNGGETNEESETRQEV